MSDRLVEFIGAETGARVYINPDAATIIAPSERAFGKSSSIPHPAAPGSDLCKHHGGQALTRAHDTSTLSATLNTPDPNSITQFPPHVLIQGSQGSVTVHTKNDARGLVRVLETYIREVG